MKRRAYHPHKERWIQIIGLSILGGIVSGILIDKWMLPLPVVHAEAVAVAATSTAAQVVQIEVAYSKEGIERLIRATFPETPNTAVAVAKSEGGLQAVVQSQYQTVNGQEPSFCAFQIHAPSWMRRARELGYGDYKTNIESCVKMARYIYDQTGRDWSPWSGFTNGGYKKFL